MSKQFPDYKTVSVENLIPYARNSRTHSDEQVAQIAASIKEFGFTNPILIDETGGIIAGHGRVLAAQKLKLKKVPAIELSHLSETQKRAYVIADNKLALNAGWDDELLRIEIDELKGLDFNIEVLGFGEVELEGLFGGDADYSLLDEFEDDEVDGMGEGVKRAIQIEFESEDYEEAQQLIKKIRDTGGYVGGVIIDALRKGLL